MKLKLNLLTPALLISLLLGIFPVNLTGPRSAELFAGPDQQLRISYRETAYELALKYYDGLPGLKDADKVKVPARVVLRFLDLLTAVHNARGTPNVEKTRRLRNKIGIQIYSFALDKKVGWVKRINPHRRKTGYRKFDRVVKKYNLKMNVVTMFSTELFYQVTLQPRKGTYLNMHHLGSAFGEMKAIMAAGYSRAGTPMPIKALKKKGYWLFTYNVMEKECGRLCEEGTSYTFSISDDRALLVKFQKQEKYKLDRGVFK